MMKVREIQYIDPLSFQWKGFKGLFISSSFTFTKCSSVSFTSHSKNGHTVQSNLNNNFSLILMDILKNFAV